MNLKMSFAALILAFSFGCSPDYALVAPKETIYVEVEVEVPVYIETEVPVEAGKVWVDSFFQPLSVDGVDILWVIDTSGSMHRYEPQLLVGIEAMLNALPASGWRLAMTSNDPGAASIEAQFPLVPGDDIDDAQNMYSTMGVGHREEGFDASYEYIINNPYASTWMRADAALLVVFVSDEEDQSDDHFPQVTDFTSWYGSMRGGSTFLSSIVNVEEVDSVCTWNVNSFDIGDRYMEATNLFGGVTVDVCSEDWSPGVADASVQIDPHEAWPLTYQPLENTIRVFIDTQLNWDWTYDAATNSVLFTSIPGGGTLVEIGYIIDPEDTSSDTGDTGDTGP